MHPARPPAARLVRSGTVLVFTVGHSNHPLDRFVALLEGPEVVTLVDVRTVPKSRKWPHFRSEELARSLPASGVSYMHAPALGGWRRPAPDSPNGAWQNESFRGYADYALTAEFEAGLEELVVAATQRRTAMMCSEALWWRCHRRLISDRLVARGHDVRHIGADGRTATHELAAFAVVDADGRVLYPERA